MWTDGQGEANGLISATAVANVSNTWRTIRKELGDLIPKIRTY
jgi:hypothetical protein